MEMEKPRQSGTGNRPKPLGAIEPLPPGPSRLSSKRKISEKELFKKPSTGRMDTEELPEADDDHKTATGGNLKHSLGVLRNLTEETPQNHLGPLVDIDARARVQNKRVKDSSRSKGKISNELEEISPERRGEKAIKVADLKDVSDGTYNQSRTNILRQSSNSRLGKGDDSNLGLLGQVDFVAGEGGRPTPKKSSREVTLKQEIKEMNRERRANILENIQKFEIKGEEKKNYNRLDQIMDSVKVQRAQYSKKLVQSNIGDKQSEGVSPPAPSPNQIGKGSFRLDAMDGLLPKANSAKTIDFSQYEGESNVSAAYKPPPLSGQLTANFKVKSKNLNEIDPKKKMSLEMEDKPPVTQPKFQNEISMLKQRRQTLDTNNLIKCMAKKPEEEFEIDNYDLEKSDDEILRLKELDPLRKRVKVEDPEERAKLLAELRKQTGDDAEFAKKWAPDELKVSLDKPDEKIKMLKRILKDRLAKTTLRKSKYPCRPLVYYFKYSPQIVELYINLNKGKRSPTASDLQTGDASKRGEHDKMGVLLRQPEKSELLKFSVSTQLHYFSPPLAKIARVYSTMKELMKANGFVLSKSQKYNFCWGFSKHRSQIRVVLPVT